MIKQKHVLFQSILKIFVSFLLGINNTFSAYFHFFMSLLCQGRVGTVGRWASSTQLHRHIPALTKLTVLKNLHSWRSSFSWFSVERLRSQDRDQLGRGMGRAAGGGKDQMVEAQEGLVGKQVPASERRREKSGEEPWGPWSQWPTRQRVWAPGGRSPGQASQSVTAKLPKQETSRNGLIGLKVWHGGFPGIFVRAEEQELSFSTSWNGEGRGLTALFTRVWVDACLWSWIAQFLTDYLKWTHLLPSTGVLRTPVSLLTSPCHRYYSHLRPLSQTSLLPQAPAWQGRSL